jgi:hypothetical protein
VCVLDEEAEEAKNDIDKKILESKKIMATVNNEYYNNKNRKKNNSVSNKFTLYKNFLLQNKNNNFPINKDIESKKSKIKAHSNNFQYNLQYLNNSPRNATYNKVMDNLEHYKNKKNILQNEDSGTPNSFMGENTPRDNDINVCEDSRTDRDFHKRKIFSEKFLEINKRKKGNNYVNSKMKELLNINNNNSTNSININDLNDDSNMKKNEDDLYRKINDISNLCSKITSEDEIYFKDMKISGDNNSKLYKKLNIFLEECKVKLNALDYENVIKLLKYYESDSDVEVKQKIKKIISNNKKLCKIFDDIFDSS